MTRFAHISDVHLGGWIQEPIQNINLQSFRKAMDICIKEKLDFVLIAGDLFDSAYPPIETLKETFAEFKKLKDAKIPCFIIAGSHDYSVSGKTFLDVLEKSGFCKNVTSYEEREGSLILNPTLFKNIAIYGYPGKKSSLEIDDLRKVKFQESPGFFKIFMLHTTLDEAKGSIPVDAIKSTELPKADYYAMGHLHIDFQYENFVYPGPIFPNNFQELEDLKFGSFYIVTLNGRPMLKKVDLRIKEVEAFEIEINNTSSATEKIILEMEKRDLNDKIILLRVSGELENGKSSDINFQQIEDYAKQKNAFFMLKNTHDLKTKDVEIEIELKNSDNIEDEIINVYSEEDPSQFNDLIYELMNSLDLEKQEDESNSVFEQRILDNVKKLLRLEI
ncbi:MAG: DNA repair exonuclease [archaeon]|nr:DNA repair exonuclease [archaeon]